MPVFLKLVVAVFVFAVLVVLVRGLWNFTRAGDANVSQSLMRMRIMLQAVAIVVIMIVLFFSGVKPNM